MSKPVVAIVGRPNVGKSTLFNVLAGEMISIVKDTPGVTRDRIYADVDWLDREFTLIDTGGIEPDSRDIILSQMREQAQIAIDTADVIIFITDVKQGLVDSDSKVADMLRRSGKPVVLVVNKVDNFDKYMADVYEFYNLGIGDPIPISAASRLGLGDMLDAVIAHFPESDGTEEDDDRPRVAIVGKPNVGKSSFINKMVKKNRAKVEDRPGVTRGNQWYTIAKNLEMLDTPGVLWPKFDDKTVGEHLAFTGAVKDQILDIELLAVRLLDFIKELKPADFITRFKLENEDIENIDSYELLKMIGKKRGMLVSGGEIDTERAAIMLLDEFRSAKLGRITVEMPQGR